MNLYEKLLKARVDLQNKKIKKSGNNKYAGYVYFELGDFLPAVNEICLTYKLMPITTFSQEMATLTIIDADKPEDKIIFTSPMADATLKGCHAIQNMGAVQTYQRRYLMMVAFEIVENDMLDGITGKPEKTADRNQKNVLSQAQITRFFTLAAKAGYTSEKAEVQLKNAFGVGSIKELTKAQYDKATKGYEDKIAKKEEGK